MVRRLKQWREGAEVERAHTVPHIGRYSVGHHSHGVATIIIALHPSPSKELIVAALLHDLHEVHTGDTPAFAKCPEFRDLEELVAKKIGTTDYLSQEDQQWLRAADRLELFCWCIDQRELGNRNTSRIYRNTLKWFEDNDIPDEVVAVVKDYDGERTLPIGAEE